MGQAPSAASSKQSKDPVSNSTESGLQAVAADQESCHCDLGFSGVMCENWDSDPCVLLDCGAHGTCLQGMCLCRDGWRGTLCEKPPCAPPSTPASMKRHSEENSL